MSIIKKKQLITIDGMDGVGKTTYVTALCEYLTQQHIPFDYHHFPDHGKHTTTMIDQYLQGALFNRYDPHHLFSIHEMFALERKMWLSENESLFNDPSRLLILERSWITSLIFQFYDYATSEGIPLSTFFGYYYLSELYNTPIMDTNVTNIILHIENLDKHRAILQNRNIQNVYVDQHDVDFQLQKNVSDAIALWKKNIDTFKEWDSLNQFSFLYPFIKKVRYTIIPVLNNQSEFRSTNEIIQEILQISCIS